MPKNAEIWRRVLGVLLMLWPMLVTAVVALIVVAERFVGIGVYRTTSLALGLRLWRSTKIAS